jgi:two-component system chemotaxis response regulator CheB
VAHRDIVVMGASAGGVEGFREVVRALSPGFPGSVFIVLHISPDAPSRLPAILGRETDLPVSHARDHAPIERGHIYIAPPDHHLILHHGRMRVVRGPRENRHRPAIDPLFRSAARSYGPRVVGVLLSGLMDDGTSGLQMIRGRNGVTIVQDPDEAEFSKMPENAVEYAKPDWVLPVGEIGPLLGHLVTEAVAEQVEEQPASGALDQEVEIAEMNMNAMETEKRGAPSGFSCPECQGVLWEIKEGELMRFRCRVGHAYSAESLVRAKSEALEAALWSALRALEESAAISRRMAERAEKNGHELVQARVVEDAMEKEAQARMVRDMLMGNQAGGTREETQIRTGTEG